MRNIEVVDYSFKVKRSKDIDTSLPIQENFKECKTVQQANVVIAAYLNKNLKDMKDLESKMSLVEIELTGESGVLTDEEIDKLIKEDRVILLVNSVYRFYLYERNENYITYINIDTPLIDSVEYRSIYVNINKEAVNYKHWTLKEITPSGGGNVDDVLVNGESVVENKIANITIPESGGEWGNISGNLDDQADLKEALDSKETSYTQDDVYAETARLNGYVNAVFTPTKIVVADANSSLRTNPDYLILPNRKSITGNLTTNMALDDNDCINKGELDTNVNNIMGELDKTNDNIDLLSIILNATITKYDSTKSYVKGDKCVYNNKMYYCESATTGAFDNTKWTEILLSGKNYSTTEKIVGFDETDNPIYSKKIEFNSSLVTSNAEQVFNQNINTPNINKIWFGGETHCEISGQSYIYGGGYHNNSGIVVFSSRISCTITQIVVNYYNNTAPSTAKNVVYLLYTKL